MSIDSKKRQKENFKDKEILLPAKCYLCNSVPEEIRSFGTKIYDEDKVYPICGSCLKKLNTINRLIINDIEGNCYTVGWFVKQMKKGKKKSSIQELEKPVNVRNLAKYKKTYR